MTRRRVLQLTMIAVAVAAVVRLPRMACAAEEYELRAAFVLNFLQFIQWPAGSFETEKSPIVIATLGEDHFRGQLEAISAGTTIGGRPIVIRHFANVAEIQPCHVLIVAASADAELPSALRRLGSNGLLTIGETDEFMKAGGIIEFYTEASHVRFEIHQDAAAHAKLLMSSKLLRLSKPRPRR